MGINACQAKMIKDSAVTAIVLAGGMATRMGPGCDKAFLVIDDRPIIDRQLKVLKRVFKEIIIVTNSKNRYNHLKGIRMISDILMRRGPLGGIYSALMASSTYHNFVIACDMPFINEALVRYMIDKKDNYDILIPKIDKKFHPLFGIYSKYCIPVMEEMLKHNRLRIAGIFSKVKTRFISKKTVEKFDKELRSLVNINTKEDLLTYA